MIIKLQKLFRSCLNHLSCMWNSFARQYLPCQACGAQIRYQERWGRDEEWLCLARCRFSWLSDLPPGCPPNPTFVPGTTPVKEQAVEHKVCTLSRRCLNSTPQALQ